MLLKSSILNNLGHYPTDSQLIAIDGIISYLHSKEKFACLILKGYAGTGKTSLVSALTNSLKEIKQRVVLLAPTGRAAKVLSVYSNFQASTIHKCIYIQKSTKVNDSKFVLNFKRFNNTIFIVDESSMISNSSLEGSFFGSGRLLDDLFQFVFNNDSCKLILVGDTAQLPPVKTELSPALDKSYLESMGFNTDVLELKDVVRQSEESGILMNATNLRTKIFEGEFNKLPKINIEKYDDVVRISGAELLEELENSFSRYGEENTKIITRSNKYANKYNAGIRSRILWKEEELSGGDLLMVVKNNYSWLDEKSPIDFIANGDIVELTKYRRTQEIYGHRFADVTLRFVDYPELEIDVKVLLDTLTTDGASMPESFYKNLYSQLKVDYEHLGDSQKIHEAILKDDFYNALQVKYAYAITCHKSQGGQWSSVFVDYGWLNKEMINLEFYRWLYTAFTRATVKLHLVNFDNEFFCKE